MNKFMIWGTIFLMLMIVVLPTTYLMFSFWWLITGDDFTDSYANQILREDCDTDRIVKAIKKFTKSYKIKVDLDRAIYGDNIKIKLKVND